MKYFFSKNAEKQRTSNFEVSFKLKQKHKQKKTAHN